MPLQVQVNCSAYEIMCCAQDILREARGCSFCGLDRTVWIFLLTHGSGLALLLCTDTDLSLRVSGAHRRAPPGATPGAPARALTQTSASQSQSYTDAPVLTQSCTLCQRTTESTWHATSPLLYPWAM